MGKIYGYARISRPQQSIERQIRSIKEEYKDAIIVEEPYTGTGTGCPEWNKLYKKVSEGDTIIFDSVSRMSGSADDGVKTYFSLFKRYVNLVFLKEGYINTSTYMESLNGRAWLRSEDKDNSFPGLNKFFRKLAERQIRIAYKQAEKETSDLKRRTKEGIEHARQSGKQIGQKRGSRLLVKKKEPAKELIRKNSRSFGGNLSDADCIKLAGTSRNTYYKYKRELRESMQKRKPAGRAQDQRKGSNR